MNSIDLEPIKNYVVDNWSYFASGAIAIIGGAVAIVAATRRNRKEALAGAYDSNSFKKDKDKYNSGLKQKKTEEPDEEYPLRSLNDAMKEDLESTINASIVKYKQVQTGYVGVLSDNMTEKLFYFDEGQFENSWEKAITSLLLEDAVETGKKVELQVTVDAQDLEHNLFTVNGMKCAYKGATYVMGDFLVDE
ncbi:MAG: hypothetical protein ACP5N3_00020 [Candidatus Nanoarchaeia archaeon]